MCAKVPLRCQSLHPAEAAGQIGQDFDLGLETVASVTLYHGSGTCYQGPHPLAFDLGMGRVGVDMADSADHTGYPAGPIVLADPSDLAVHIPADHFAWFGPVAADSQIA